MSPTERTRFVGFSRFFGGAKLRKLRPVLPVTAARIGLQVDDGAGPRWQLPDRGRRLARLGAYLEGLNEHSENRVKNSMWSSPGCVWKK